MRKASKEEQIEYYRKLNKNGKANDLESFMQGVKFLEKFKDPNYLMGTTNHLGFEIDIKKIY